MVKRIAVPWEGVGIQTNSPVKCRVRKQISVMSLVQRGLSVVQVSVLTDSYVGETMGCGTLTAANVSSPVVMALENIAFAQITISVTVRNVYTKTSVSGKDWFGMVTLESALGGATLHLANKVVAKITISVTTEGARITLIAMAILRCGTSHQICAWYIATHYGDRKVIVQKRCSVMMVYAIIRHYVMNQAFHGMPQVGHASVIVELSVSKALVGHGKFAMLALVCHLPEKYVQTLDLHAA